MTDDVCPMTREPHIVTATPLGNGEWFNHCITCGKDWISRGSDAEPKA